MHECESDRNAGVLERHLLTQADVGFVEVDLLTNTVLHLASLERDLGYEPGEVGGQLDRWFGLVHPADRQQCIERFQQHIRGETSNYRSEHRMIRRDGSTVWIRA